MRLYRRHAGRGGLRVLNVRPNVLGLLSVFFNYFQHRFGLIPDLIVKIDWELEYVEFKLHTGRLCRWR